MRHTTLCKLGILTPRVADVDTAHGRSRGPRRAQMARAQRSRTALRSAGSGQHLLVSVRVTGADGRRRTAARGTPGGTVMSPLAPALQSFFTDRLIRQRHVSSHTIAAYRDSLRLLLGFASAQTGVAPSALDLADLDAP